MYYIQGYCFGKRGFSSVGKLFNQLAYMSDIGKLYAIQVHDAVDSFGNVYKTRVPGIGLDNKRLHKDLEVIKDSCGSSGKVICHRYLQYDYKNKQIVDVICDPPIEICKLNIH